MRIKKGDIVQIIAGRDRGKTGKVLRVDKGSDRILVEGINVFKKRVKPKRQGEKGQNITLPRPVAAANILPQCPVCGRGVRVGFRSEGALKTRYCRRCKSVL